MGVKKTDTMNIKDYIKVTTADGNTTIVRATNKNFYLRTGAKIEQPTEEEVANKYPEVSAEIADNKRAAEIEKQLGFEIIKRDERLAAMEAEMEEKNAEIERLKAENSDLSKRLAAMEGDAADDKKDTKSSKPKTTK